MILGYKKQFPWGLPTCFKGKIINGEKKHTIRADKHERWKPGMRIQHAHGVRTKFYEQFAEGECISIQKIEILRMDLCETNFAHIVDDKIYSVFVNEEQLTIDETIELAANDGFDSIEDFFKWFDADFTGKISHWTDLRY